MSRAQAFHWHKMFSEGRNIVEDEQRSGRPSTTRTSDNTELLRELVLSNRRLTVKMIADEVNVTREAVRRILTEELWMRKICAKMVPRNLTRSFSVVQFLTSKGITLKPQPPYSPNLAPYDFLLFKKAKSARKTIF